MILLQRSMCKTAIHVVAVSVAIIVFDAFYLYENSWRRIWGIWNDLRWPWTSRCIVPPGRKEGSVAPVPRFRAGSDRASTRPEGRVQMNNVPDFAIAQIPMQLHEDEGHADL